MGKIMIGSKLKKQLNNILPYLLVGACIALSLYLLVLRFDEPVLGMGAFRQAQNAIIVWAMGLGGDLLVYELPVLGFPWTAPFEFPLYQWTALLFTKMGLGIEASLRLSSFIYLIVAIVLFYWVVLIITGERVTASVVACIAFTSPVVLMWGTAAMIESTALALSTGYLLLVLIVFKQRKDSLVYCVLAGGVAFLAAATKITTFLPYFLISIFYAAAASFPYLKSWPSAAKEIGARKIQYLVFGAGNVVAFVFFLLLTRAYDAAKRGTLADALTSSNLSEWNFGSFDDRFSEADWGNLITRSLDHTFGWLGIALLSVIVIYGLRRTPRDVVFLAVGAICAPLVFWNLYVVHDYYTVAIAPLLIAAAIIYVVKAINFKSQYILAAVGIFGLILNWNKFDSTYMFTIRPLETGAMRAPVLLDIATEISNVTDSDSVVVIAEGGWSPAIPFYAKRRAIMTGRRSPEFVINLTSSQELSGPGREIGAVVVCDQVIDIWERRLGSEEVDEAMARIFEGLMVREIGGCTIGAFELT